MRQTKSSCKSAAICKSRFSSRRHQSLSRRRRTQFHLRVLFVLRYRVAAHNAGFSSSAIASLFLFFSFPRSKNPPLFPRKTRGIPRKVRAQRGARRGRELSDCRHLRAGLSLINDGNIPPYTVTRLTRERSSPSVVYKRYCRCNARRCAASLLAFTASTTALDKKHRHPS